VGPSRVFAYPLRSLVAPLTLTLLVLIGQGPAAPERFSSNSPPGTYTPGAGPRRGLLSATAAFVPGLVLHGSGHFAGGDRRTGLRLLAAEGLGLAGLVAGFAALGLTGASRHVVSPMILLTVAGAGLFTTSALADLYGIFAPPGGAGAASSAVATIQASAGTWFVRNPTFPYRWLGSAGVDLGLGRWRLAPVVYRSFAGPTLRAELHTRYRLSRSRPGDEATGQAPNGDFIALGAAVVHHREAPDAVPFDTSTGEVTLNGRNELARLAPSLAGSFVDWALGLGMGATHYGGPVGTFEATQQLLARFAYGFYLGRGPAPRAEILLAYDHRHDDFAGGLKIPGLGSGPGGHFGLEATAHLYRSWGVRAVAQLGSAHVIGLSLLYRALENDR
jgi:hypothetical protein